MSQLLLSKISAVRRKLAMVKSLRGVAAGAGAIVLLLAAGMLADWYLELPRMARAGLLALDLTAMTYVLLMHVLAPLIWGPDDEEIALMVERATPQFATRLIASVQLSRPGAVPANVSASVVRAMVSETEAMSHPIDFSEVVTADQALKAAAISGLLLVLGLGAFLYGNGGGANVSTDLLARAFLSERPVPRKTRVVVTAPNKIIPLGDPITIEVFASGEIPANGRVDISYKSGRKASFTLEPVEDPAHSSPAGSKRFMRMIESVQDSFTYRVAMNDARTSRYSVTASPRPSVGGVDFTLVYPKYTRHAPEHKSPGDLTMLAGSDLQIKVKSSKPVKDGVSMVRLVGLSQELPLKRGTAADEMVATIPVPAKGLTGLSFYLQDEQGIGSKGETVYPVDVVLDKDPTIKITYPDRKEELALTQARMLVAFEATDDFGVAKIVLKHKLESDENGAATAIEMDLSGVAPDELKRIQRRYNFDLTPLRLAEQATVEYWVEVYDGNDKTGPGKAISEHYKVKIVSELEKRAELMNRLNDQLGTVDVVTQDQEKLNQTLGKLITEKK